MSLDTFWDNILSRQPDLVIAAYHSLNKDDRAGVMDHLKKMAEEPGWHPEQQKSARAALAVLGSIPDD